MSEAQLHVESLVRMADRDRYLATLYAPAEKRRGLLALHAFNVEIGSIRERVRQPLTGEVRLQWWRDALAAGSSADSVANPVLAELSWTIETYGLPIGAFENYLEARIFDLYDDPMPSRVDLEGYCGETTAALIQMAVMVLDPLSAREMATASGHAGCAQMITGLMRSASLHRARGQCYVPLDILAAAGSTPETWLSGAQDAAAIRVAGAMTALARQHYSEFVAAIGSAPEAVRPAFLVTSLAPAYLARIERVGLIDGGDISTLTRHWTLFRRARSGWGK